MSRDDQMGVAQAEAEAYSRDEDPTPLDLAMRLDPAIVPTPALRLLAAQMVGVRDAIEVMYERRALHAALVRSGVDGKAAIERATKTIEDRGISRLIMSMPPQEGKSNLISIYGSIWLYRQFPQLKETIVSYDGSNAETFSYAIRAAVEQFDGRGDEVDLGLRLAMNQKAVSRFRFTSGGTMYAIGIRGGLTGRPSDYMNIDDPTKDQEDADSEINSSKNWEWWSTTARPRLAPWAPVSVTMTRWNEVDLGGRLQTKQVEDEALGRSNYDKWKVIVIPAQADHDPSRGERDILGREPGQWLVSARGRSDAEWEATRAATIDRHWSALYQGKPTPGIGDILHEDWWGRYDAIMWSRQKDGTYLVPGCELTQSWDFTFDSTKGSDFVVGQVWAKRGVESFLIYQIRDRLSFPETIDAVLRVTHLFPQARRKIVEKKANGAAVLSTLRKQVAGMVPVTPDQSKTARAEASSIFVRAGNFWLPTDDVAHVSQTLAFDVQGFIAETKAFPHGAHDDQVDAWSQYAKMLYVEGSQARLISPVGRLPRGSLPPKDTREQLSPMQVRLLAASEGN
jgi:predicted phage terminase large subunit-like protein